MPDILAGHGSSIGEDKANNIHSPQRGAMLHLAFKRKTAGSESPCTTSAGVYSALLSSFCVKQKRPREKFSGPFCFSTTSRILPVTFSEGWRERVLWVPGESDQLVLASLQAPVWVLARRRAFHLHKDLPPQHSTWRVG